MEESRPAFVEEEGATALRPDLIRLIGFAQPARIEVEGGFERCCAGVCAVWNGGRGYLALLLRHLDRPRVQRFVYTRAIESESGLSDAMEEAAALVSAFGLQLVREEFSLLDEPRRAERMELWNDLRKPKRTPAFPEPESSPEPAAPPGPAPGKVVEVPVAAAGAQQPAAAAAAEEPAVLGRLKVLRVDPSGGVALSPLGRLLSFF